MTKRLLQLGGLAIVIVVVNHAAHYGQIAMFLWADSYRSVSVPDWGAIGSTAYWVLIVVRSFGVFTVPAFLFSSGYFSVYIARSYLPTRNRWGAVSRRVINLIIPYAFWSAVVFVGDALQGVVYAPLDYCVKLLTTGASSHLYFVPLLCACYLLSPWVIASVRRSPRLIVSVSALLQAGALVGRYLGRFGAGGTITAWLARLTPWWSLTWWFVYFVLGVVVALNIQRTRDFLWRYRWQTVALAVTMWLFCLLEADALLRVPGTEWTAGIDTVSGSLFAVFAIASFLAFSEVRVPGMETLSKLSKYSYGLYLVHLPLMGLLAYIIRRMAPWMLAYQLPLVLLLFAAGFGLPLLAMKALSRWRPTRRIYPYLFG